MDESNAAEGPNEITTEMAPIVDPEFADPTGAAKRKPAHAAEADFGPGSHPPLADVNAAPDGFPIKGNADSRLYHVPGSAFFDRTIAEVWFASAEAAEGAGFSLPPSQRKVADAAEAVEAPAPEVADVTADAQPEPEPEPDTDDQLADIVEVAAFAEPAPAPQTSAYEPIGSDSGFVSSFSSSSGTATHDLAAGVRAAGTPLAKKALSAAGAGVLALLLIRMGLRRRAKKG